MNQPAQRICVVHLSAIGDVVNGLPFVNSLKAHDPNCRITWIVEPLSADLLRPHPSVDEVIVFEKSRGLAGLMDLRRKLAGRRFDLTVNLGLYFKSIWPTLLSGAPRRLGFDHGRAQDGIWLASNDRIPARPRAHVVDMFAEFLEHLGVPVAPVQWNLQITEAEHAAKNAFRSRFGSRPVVAIVAASSNPKKDWLPERFARVVDALQADFGFAAVLIGGPGEREAGIARQISAGAEVAPVWSLENGVRKLVWKIQACDLVIAPDTGPLHIARALSVPVIGLYGHTNPWRVGPYRAYEDLWVDRYTDPGAEPDRSHFPSKLGRMETIGVDDVLQRVEWAVSHYGVAAGVGGQAGARAVEAG